MDNAYDYKLPEYLASGCTDHCTDLNCTEAVKQGPTGWYITIHHCGFNTTPNNRDGYKTQAKATEVWKRYTRITTDFLVRNED